MALVTTDLALGGRTAHFAVSYEDSLPRERGLYRAQELLQTCEADFALIASWFAGVTFRFEFPIHIELRDRCEDGQSALSWASPSDLQKCFGFEPTLEISQQPSTSRFRFLLAVGLSGMFLVSQGAQWTQPSGVFSGASLNSMGAALLWFLGSEFLTETSGGSAFGLQTASFWLNDPARPNWVDSVSGDVQQSSAVGCGTCFLFFLKYQIGKSIQSIIGAPAANLGDVYKNLLGAQGGWQTFRPLVDLHYPQTNGRLYFPPLDNLFPIAKLGSLLAPPVVSWVTNGAPNVAEVSLARPVPGHAGMFVGAPLPVDVDVALTSDNPALISLAPSVATSKEAYAPLEVPPQGPDFASTTVRLTASYAGATEAVDVRVVPPRELPVGPIVITASSKRDDCAFHFIEGEPETFHRSCPLVDHTGLVGHWIVSGALAQDTPADTLTIPSLPPAGTRVRIEAVLTNASGLRATGSFEFRTIKKPSESEELARRIVCLARQIVSFNRYIPPWVPIEKGRVRWPEEQLARLEDQAEHLVATATVVGQLARELRGARKLR